jgi:hypothetical protein
MRFTSESIKPNAPLTKEFKQEYRLQGYETSSYYLIGDTLRLRYRAKLCYVRFEVFTAVTMKNAVFWDIKTQFVPHRKQYFFAAEPRQLMLFKI